MPLVPYGAIKLLTSSMQTPPVNGHLGNVPQLYGYGKFNSAQNPYSLNILAITNPPLWDYESTKIIIKCIMLPFNLTLGRGFIEGWAPGKLTSCEENYFSRLV